MDQHIKAVYTGGVLKPIDPIYLKDEEIVLLSVKPLADPEEETDEDYHSPLEELGGPEVTMEEIRAIMAKIPGSLTEDFERERDERF